MPGFEVARRFRIFSLLATLGVVLVGVAFAVVAIALAVGRGFGANALVGIALVVGVLVFLVAVGATISSRYGAAIRALRSRFPDGAVFLARRQPTVVTDVETWMSSKGLTSQISDGWMPAVVDARGISAWTAGRHPEEVLLMEWAELGEIAVTKTSVAVGAPTWKVSVDVQPFVVPLTVEVGYSWGLVTAAVGHSDIEDVVRITNALRPPAS